MLRLTVAVVVMAAVGCQVIGIDFGTEFWKAAIISPGKGFVVVENTKSERKTPNTIAFIDGVRLFESEAASKKSRYPKQTFADLNLLMQMIDNPDLKVEYDVPYELTNGTIVFQLPEDERATIEQVLAMILKTIKQHASKQAGTGVRDCALTVPSDWGVAARTALVNAAYIADLAVLSVVSDNTAAALNYAMTRNDNESLNVMIYNLGSGKLQVSIVRFYGYTNPDNNKTIESLEVLSHETNTEFGGYEMDNKIAQVLAKKFTEKTKKPIGKQNQRAWAKLLQKCSDVKETLSANKEAQVYIESLIDGVDLNVVIQRAEVEELINFDVILEPVMAALKEAGLNKEDIASVELIGGASRIPRVVSTVTQFFAPVEVGTHINGDEAIALGSVLHAANMSSAFRVKEIHLYDTWRFAVGLDILNDKEQSVFKDDEFFKPTDYHWMRKEVELTGADSQLTINVYGKDKELLKKFKTTNLLNWKERFDNGNLTKEPTVKLQFVLSSVGVIDTKESFVSVWRNQSVTKEEVEYVKEKIVYPDDEAGDEPADEIKKEEVEEEADKKKQQKDEDKEETKEQKKADQEGANVDSEPTDAAKEDASQIKTEQEPKKKPKRPKFKTVTVRKNVTTVSEKNIKHVLKFDVEQLKYKRYSKEEVETNRLLLKKFESREQLIKDTAQAKNELESRLYSIRNDFEEKYMNTFGTEEEVDHLKKVVEEELAWLEENSYTAKKEDFQNHLHTLFEAYRPIYNRTTEYQDRAATVNKTIEYLGTVYEKTIELNTSHPWTIKRIERLLKRINETMEWYSDKIKQQSERPFNENPLVYNYEPIHKAEKLRDEYYAIRLVPRPKTKKLKDEDKVEKPEEPSGAKEQATVEEPLKEEPEQGTQTQL